MSIKFDFLIIDSLLLDVLEAKLKEFNFQKTNCNSSGYNRIHFLNSLWSNAKIGQFDSIILDQTFLHKIYLFVSYSS